MNNIINFPTLYALSKTGSIRVYDIFVEDKGSSAILTTRKKVTLNGKWTEDSYEFTTGVNIGKSNETTYLQQALNEARSQWNKLKDGGFSEDLPDVNSKFNTDANGNIKPMLAISFSKKKIKLPCLVQPKLDGVRCLALLINGEVKLISRKGKPYNIPHIIDYFTNHKELLPLDGELYCHHDLTFQEIVSAVKCQSPLTEQIKYAVYDKPLNDISNDKRWNILMESYNNTINKDAPTYYVETVICNTFEEIMDYHKYCVENGYEGVIIRNMDGKYEFGFRSNDLIKYKEFNDDEFEITNIVEATGRDSGTAVFVCKTKDNRHFNVKPQGSKTLRTEYFEHAENLIGKFATVKYQGLSDDGIPRFPSAISVRDYE